MTDQPDDKAMADAEEYNRIAKEHGIADPGGMPEQTVDDEEPKADLPLDDTADDAVEELGPAQ